MTQRRTAKATALQPDATSRLPCRPPEVPNLVLDEILELGPGLFQDVGYFGSELTEQLTPCANDLRGEVGRCVRSVPNAAFDLLVALPELLAIRFELSGDALPSGTLGLDQKRGTYSQNRSYGESG